MKTGRTGAGKGPARLLAAAACLLLAACAGNKGSVPEGDAVYFCFADDGRTVSGLTEEGKRQCGLVVPGQAYSLTALAFADSKAEEVRFEKEHDVDLGLAFATAKELRKISLPDGLTEVPYMAFGSCEKLGSVVIPPGVTGIGGYAFSFCTDLKEVTFAGTGCASIGRCAFEACPVSSVVLPEGLSVIEEGAFSLCDRLTSVELPSTVRSVGAGAFSGEKISEVYFAAGTRDISVDPTAFGSRTPDITAYIAEGSWMDTHRGAWDVGFGEVRYLGDGGRQERERR